MKVIRTINAKQMSRETLIFYNQKAFGCLCFTFTFKKERTKFDPMFYILKNKTPYKLYCLNNKVVFN